MPAMQPEAIFDSLLSAAEALRTTARERGEVESMPLAFHRSTLGLAALIESWCVDHAEHLLPELVDGRRVESSADERALLEDIIARIRR